MNKVVDLHCHPSAKALFSWHTNQGERAWKSYLYRANVLGFGVDEIIGDILDSQSSLTQIEAGNGKLIFWTIYPFEKEYLEINQIQRFSSHIEKPNRDLKDFYEDGGFVSKQVDYLNILINFELNLVNNTTNINILNRANPKLKNDSGIINVAICVEGVHSFLDRNSPVWDIDEPTFLKNAEDFFKLGKLFYLTLAHLTPNGVFNQAYAGKLLKKKEMANFFPRRLSDSVISSLGLKIVDLCIKYDINVDVKHMSFRSRISLYDYLDSLKQNGMKIVRPIASHVGVMGCRSTEFKDRFDLSKGLLFDTYKYEEGGSTHYMVECCLIPEEYQIPRYSDKVQFHNRTLSLFDEDIMRIVNLNGFIAFNLDQRVLGANLTKNSEKDVLTLDDFVWLCRKSNVNPYSYLQGSNYNEVKNNSRKLKTPEKVIWMEESPIKWIDDGGPANSTAALAHVRRFCFNIIHTMEVIKAEGGSDPWKYVGLGSDFDGLINPVNCCKDFASMQGFIDKVRSFLNYLGDFQSEYGISVDNFIHRFFYQNIIDFYQIDEG